MSREQTFDINLQNGGNTPITFSVKAVDYTGRLRFEGERDSVHLEPEARETVQLRVAVEDRPLVGAPYFLPFEVRISAADSPPEVKIGQFEVRPLLPLWLFLLLPLLTLCLLLFLLLTGWPPGQNETVTPTLTSDITDITPSHTPTATQRATSTATTTSTGTPTATASAPVSPSPTVTPSGTASPTPSPTVSVAPTFTPTPPPTLTPTRSGSPTPTVTRVYGPLSFEVEIVWRIDPTDRRFAIASVTITAIGGDGNYTYYRDDIRQVGAEFEYVWRSCSPNPISFRVTSGDGQSARREFGQFAPCP
jgi:hypothetical protein